MYKVFVNDRPIILTDKVTKEVNHKLFLLETADIKQVIKLLNKGKVKEVHLYHPDRDKLLPLFKEKLPIIQAGGGLVRNPDNEVLFIYRNDKWDLPKGKLDKGETIEECSIREVEEETGIKKLKLHSLIDVTYHILKRNGKYKIKETFWYNMTSNYTGTLVAQEDEGIAEVVWKNPDEIKDALKNSYKNIEALFDKLPITA
ncbi:NUDIX hydrolase [Zhouia sp. PK063]|uniref:NUDIX hydrolase n=1 Tax=Zhouia sp. PK063 TaxID=3373602 RepID=UPI0037A9334C